jgi:hypothetical protein
MCETHIHTKTSTSVLTAILFIIIKKVETGWGLSGPPIA